MKIINPIYDNAFKYLMDNEEIAKIVLSIILDTKVVSLQSKPQETPLTNIGGVSLARYDFKAVIKNEKGEDKTVLIELQKYKTPNPISRFRQYLAQNYMKEETIITPKGEVTATLPIISIYILGFDLPEFNCKAIKIDNKPSDIIGQQQLDVKSDFVEQLTHQCYILLAVDKPEVETNTTRLEKFLDLFIQKLKGEDANTIIDIDDQVNDKAVQSIMLHLNKATLNQKLVRTLAAEKEHTKGIETLEKQLEKERKEKEEAKARAEKERKEKEEAKAREEEKSIKLAMRMKKYGESIDEIIAETGLLKEMIEKF